MVPLSQVDQIIFSVKIKFLFKKLIVNICYSFSYNYKSLLQIKNWSSRILDVPDTGNMGHTFIYAFVPFVVKTGMTTSVSSEARRNQTPILIRGPKNHVST